MLACIRNAYAATACFATVPEFHYPAIREVTTDAGCNNADTGSSLRSADKVQAES